MTGVYKIINLINKDCYIGSSIDIEQRWNRHKYLFDKQGRHYDYYLYRAFRKYGLDNFDFLVLETCEPHELIEKELYYFQLYKPKYNLIKPNQNPAQNKEVQRRISEGSRLAWKERDEKSKEASLDNLAKGHKSFNSNKFSPVKIKAIEIKSGRVYKFDSMYQAEKMIGVHRSSISQILDKSHPRKRSKGFTFEYWE